MSDLIWESELDERYQCEVNLIQDHVGMLTVFDKWVDEIILEERVMLSYNAQFGPDILDIQEWQNKILEVVDGDEDE